MTDPAEAWLDDTDQAILDQVAALYARFDPPPPDLDERTRFAMALADLDAEVARLSEDRLVGSGARATERTRTITFDADSRTIRVTVADRPDGLVRLDGWLAPAAALRVELRIGGSAPHAPASSQVVTSDDSGRFVFDGVPRGLAQLLVHPLNAGGTSRVVTPSLVL